MIRSILHVGLLAGAALLLGGLLPAVVMAGAAGDSGAVLEEVVVTARKRSERLQDVPVSVGVLDAETLNSEQDKGLADYFAQVPGLALNATTSGRMSLAIRGITTGGTTNPTVGVTIDDVPVGASTGITYSSLLAADVDPATLERIEVLRGPQGTLYGVSSLGGLLRYVTAKPEFGRFFGHLQADGAAVAEGGGDYSVRGSVNLPVSGSQFAATAAGFIRHDSGIVDNLRIGSKNVDSVDAYGGRLSALWQPSESFSARVSALYQKTEGDGSSDIEADANLRPLGGRLAQHRIADTGAYSRRIEQYDATLNLALGWADLTSITGYGRSRFHDSFDNSDFLGFLTEIVTGRSDLGTKTLLPADTNKFSQELRLSSQANARLEWLLGAFYTRESSDVQYNLYAIDPATGALETTVLLDAFPSSLKERALFGTLTWHFTDRFDVQVGGRTSRNTQQYDETISGPLYDPAYVVHATSDDQAFTYLLSPRLRFSDHLMVYGRVASGYRAGGPNPGAGLGLPARYGSDKTISYELGLKGEFADRRLSLDASVYYIDWRDIQLQQRDPDTQFVYYTNAGKARSQGLELTAQAVPVPGLTVVATVAYNDAQLSEPTSGGVVAQAGDALPYSAKWTGSLSVEKEFRIGERADAFVGGSLAYVGSRFEEFAPDAATARIEMPSYATLDLRCGVTFSRWKVSLFGKNLTNRLGILSAKSARSSTAPDMNVLNIIRPRAIGLALSTKF